MNSKKQKYDRPLQKIQAVKRMRITVEEVRVSAE